MSKPNKDGWIRHRGWKCPVEKGALVDVRYRDGTFGYKLEAGRDYHFDTEHHSGWDAHFEYWDHDRMSGDIMAWRPHKPSILDEPGEPNDALKEVLELDAPKPIEQRIIESEQAAIARYADDPRIMRDRIREIDVATKEEEARHCAAMKAYDEERASLVAKLKAEGFVLIQGDEANSGEESAQQDMSDPANWRVGDLVKVLDPEDSGLRAGDNAKIIEMDHGADDMPCKLEGASTWLWTENMEWHSRPPQ